MLTERPPTQHILSTPIPRELNALFEKTNINAILQEQAIAEFSSKHLQTLMLEIAPEGTPPKTRQTSAQQQAESGTYPESDYQWLMEVLETLTDIVERNVDNNFAALPKVDYEQLDAVLKELIYTVGDNEKHPLAPLMDFIGVLISQYEDEHFPKLPDLFPELKEGLELNDKKNENQQDNPTKESQKPTIALAAEAFFPIGNLLSHGGKTEEAISAYDQVIQLNPEYINVYYNRGRAKGILGQYEDEIADLDEALRLEPNYAEIYLLRGSANVALNRYESAIADIDKSIQLNLDKSIVYLAIFLRGCANVLLTHHKSAITDFDETLRLNIDYSHVYSVYFLRGYSKSELGLHEAAIADFDETIKLEPDNAVAYNNRGHLKNKLEQYESAITDCNKCIELDPNHAWAYTNRGYAKIKLGQLEDALIDCDKAISLDPTLAEAHETLGKAQTLLGRTQEAKADFQKALEFAEQMGNQELKFQIEQSLQELENTK